MMTRRDKNEEVKAYLNPKRKRGVQKESGKFSNLSEMLHFVMLYLFFSLSVAPRGRKRLTCLSGLKSYGMCLYIRMDEGISSSIPFPIINTVVVIVSDIDLKVAAKFFGTKFACGASVTGEDEIVIQGDVKDELFDLLPEKWPQIDEDSIDDLGEVKR